MIKKTLTAGLLAVALMVPGSVDAQLQQLPLDPPVYNVPPVERVPIGPIGEIGPVGPVVRVPEPGTWLMLATGFLGLGVVTRRRMAEDAA